jgi:preprotein translocase subunit YajC
MVSLVPLSGGFVAAASSSKGSSSALGVLVPLILIFGVVALFAAMRRSRSRATQRLEAPLVPGAEVVTRAGMFGIVREVSADELVIEVAPGVLVRMLPTAVFSRDKLEAEDARRDRRRLRQTPSGETTDAAHDHPPDGGGGLPTES